MKTLEAIRYLASNAYPANEWQEAGMWHAVQTVLVDPNKTWDPTELDELIEKARNH